MEYIEDAGHRQQLPPISSKLDQTVKRDFRRLFQIIVTGPQAMQFIGNIKGRQDGDAVDIGGSGPLLHVLHPPIDECCELPDVLPVVRDLQTVRLTEDLDLDAFHAYPPSPQTHWTARRSVHALHPVPTAQHITAMRQRTPGDRTPSDHRSPRLRR